MSTTKKATSIAELGEFGLIEHIAAKVKLHNKSTQKGIGDDAAILDFSNKQAVATTDLLMEGIHFDLMYCPLKHLGYKAVIVNLSDVYAMNAKPTQILVSLAVPRKFNLEMVDELYEGIFLATSKYEVDLVGGDTTTSLTGLTISITAIGEANPNDIVCRDGAKLNDLVCVSGDLGSSFLGLQLLEREKKMFLKEGVQPDLKGHDYILERQLKPEARKDIIAQFAANNFKPTAMIDISDGLSSELKHICSKSGVGCNIYEEKIPVSPEANAIADEFGIGVFTAALNGGEDYELLFTARLEDYKIVSNMSGVSIIGHICDASEGINLITSDGRSIPITAQGWNALK